MKRLIPRRRWPRHLLVGANIVVALSLITTAGIYGYVQDLLGDITVIGAPHEDRTTGPSTDGLQAENILFIGNETRCGLTGTQQQEDGSCADYSGSLSDVIMVMHLDPAKDTASLLSIPRDLFVPMPSGTPYWQYQKVDAALNVGSNGPDNLIAAIEQDLGIPINHYVELKFDGLAAVVNALGGIRLDFPMPLFDDTSLLFINNTGCQTINGTKALALVRSRELQYDPPGDTAQRADWPYDPKSDLSRIVRDHVFLRVLFSTAINKGLGDPATLLHFLPDVLSDMTMDPGLKNQILSLATHYRHVNPNAVPELTLPITTVPNYYYGGSDIGDVDFPVQNADNKVIAQWDGQALPSPQKPSTVNVYNIAGTANLASDTSTALRADGFNAVDSGDGTVGGTPSETFVQYRPSELAKAIDVMKYLNGAVMLEPDSSLPAGTINVDAGSLLAVVPPHSSSPATSATTAPGGTAPSTTATTVPTPDGQTPSSSTDQLEPWDPIPCVGSGVKA